MQSKPQLDVLPSTWPLVKSSRHVWIDLRALPKLATWVMGAPKPEWRPNRDWDLPPDALPENMLLLLHSLNFCFWGEPRWQVAEENGFRALCLCFERALKAGLKLWEPDYWKDLREEELRAWLCPQNEIPLFHQRLQNVRELGEVLNRRWSGSFAKLLEEAGDSACGFVKLLSHNFSSFRDLKVYQGKRIAFFKRAQILAVDLKKNLGPRGLCQFRDTAELTAFADYKIPQVLQASGLLRYSPGLLWRLRARAPLAEGSAEELEIRASMVWAVEFLRQHLADKDFFLEAWQLDEVLWTLTQEASFESVPYHRTRTIYY